MKIFRGQKGTAMNQNKEHVMRGWKAVGLSVKLNL
jgi:hypothetical protein